MRHNTIPLTQKQRAVLSLARRLSCTIYYDSPRPSKKERARIRIKGGNAHNHDLVSAVKKAFGSSYVRVYIATLFIRSMGTPALSILRRFK